MSIVNANAGGSLSAIQYAAEGAGTNATPVTGTFGDAILRIKKVGGGQVVAGSIQFCGQQLLGATRQGAH